MRRRLKNTVLPVCLLGAGFVQAAAPTQSAAPGAPATGDQHRSYVFAQTGDTMPYRLFVPVSYDGKKSYPLVVVLHGGGATEDHPMDGTGLQAIASTRGYIVLSPIGYNRFGGYGNTYPVVVTPSTASGSTDFAATARAEGPARPGNPAAPPEALHATQAAHPPARADEYLEQPPGVLTDAHIGELSEAETLAAIADVERVYRIDSNRIYLMGNSAGGIGTLYLAAKYPERWAAIAPQGGVIAAWSYPYWRLRDAHLAALVVHGDHDEHCNAEWARAMVKKARADGADATFLLVPGGTHGNAWTLVLAQIFDFFDTHVRVQDATATAR